MPQQSDSKQNNSIANGKSNIFIKKKKKLSSDVKKKEKSKVDSESATFVGKVISEPQGS